MNCPVCNRSLAPTLSICPSCGAMMNDTVREELQSKITAAPVQRVEPQPRPSAPRTPMLTQPAVKRQETSGLAAARTNPTLVEFQTKSAALPDWRLQLQNMVQQRRGAATTGPAEGQTQFPAATAARVPVAPRPEPPGQPESSDPRVASAMRRIEESRKAFMPGEKATSRPVAKSNYRFDVVSPTSTPAARPVSAAAAPARAVLNTKPKPQLVTPIPAAAPPPYPVQKVDTNKLPQLPVPVEERVVEIDVHTTAPASMPAEFKEINRIRIKAEPESGPLADDDREIADDEIEDLAPFSMRFSAGVFDLIIGAFAAMLLLSPVAFTNQNWFSMPGMLTFAATWAVVLFIYMTACLGFFGKTMGMRLFSLELVDAVENEYPTLHQAAVSSSLFLLSIAFGGAGFLTIFFNEEKRAVHDLLSGTIIVKEF